VKIRAVLVTLGVWSLLSAGAVLAAERWAIVFPAGHEALWHCEPWHGCLRCTHASETTERVYLTDLSMAFLLYEPMMVRPWQQIHVCQDFAGISTR